MNAGGIQRVSLRTPSSLFIYLFCSLIAYFNEVKICSKSYKTIPVYFIHLGSEL